MCAPIGLKFGTPIRILKVNTGIKFGVNLINIQGAISDFTHKAKLNFCHTYRVNCFEEQAQGGPGIEKSPYQRKEEQD